MSNVNDPRSDGRLLDELCLHMIPGIGPRIHQTLLSRFASAAGVLAATVAQLEELRGVGPKLAGGIATAKQTTNAEQELLRCRELGIELLLVDSPHYPRLLTEICDAPSLLYCKGQLRPQDEIALAIVGSRRCTIYGKQQAERLAGGLARAGVTIVSGLARGIDAAAHRGALAAGGRTIAVTATGLASVYPPEHLKLFDQIVEQGAALSESHLDQQPVSGLFPQRNRLISGLSIAVVVVEASRNSGALHTTRHAMEQGRDVMAVPGASTVWRVKAVMISFVKDARWSVMWTTSWTRSDRWRIRS